MGEMHTTATGKKLWEAEAPVTFSGVCIVTDDVPRLRAFYERIFDVTGEGDDEHYDLTPAGVPIAIFATGGMERMAPGSMAGAGVGNVVIAAHLDGGAAVLDAVHERLLALGIPIVKPPATYPWGLRSVWFRDPDGNIVDFATRVTGE